MNREFAHSGIKGMHWGVRRFQNADGTRTAAGKKRYAENDSKMGERLKNAASKISPFKKKGAEETAAKKPKSLKDMSDDDLKKETARMNLEKTYLQTKNQLADEAAKDYTRTHPGQVAMKKMANELATKVVKDVGNKVIDAAIKKAFEPTKSLEDRQMDALKKTAERVKLEYQTANNKQKLKELRNADKKPDDENKDKKKKKKKEKTETTASQPYWQTQGFAHGDYFSMNELYHHGIKGMHWGIRRASSEERAARKTQKKADKAERKEVKQLTKTINKHEKEAAKHYTNATKVMVEDVAPTVMARNKALSRGKTEKAKVLNDMTMKGIKTYNDLMDKSKASEAAAEKARKEVSKYSNYIVQNSRGGVSVSAIGRYYTTTYDKTKVRKNTEHNRNRRTVERSGYHTTRYRQL